MVLFTTCNGESQNITGQMIYYINICLWVILLYTQFPRLTDLDKIEEAKEIITKLLNFKHKISPLN